ncbi:MAG: hypothetical protein HYY14_04130 [Candidatus Omnitrophica bacterium]|nr:hypothetical protein [Candidatus Omnitrophota bacterium]
MRLTIVSLALVLTACGCATASRRGDGTMTLEPVRWHHQEFLLGIRSLTPHGAAEIHGLRVGDLILSVDGEPVGDREALERRVREGQGPIELNVLSSGVEWSHSLPEQFRTTGLGVDAQPSYRTVTEKGVPLAIAEGRLVVVSAWARQSKDLMFVDLRVENLSDSTIEVTPRAFTLLDSGRKVVRPYHPRDLAGSYLSGAELALDEADIHMGGAAGRRHSVKISSLDPISGLISALLALPFQTAEASIREARKAQVKAEAIVDRAYAFGPLPARASQEGLLFYPHTDELPITLTVTIGEDHLNLVFMEPA